MPRTLRPSKKSLLRAELAVRLGLPLADILTREEVAAVLGVHPKTMSNGGVRWPRFYLAAIGRNGWALYRRDWIEAFAKPPEPQEGPKLPEGKQDWPPEPPAPPPPPVATPRENIDFMSTHLGIEDEDYRASLHGEPSTPEPPDPPDPET